VTHFFRRRLRLALLVALSAIGAELVSAQGLRLPADVVDAFHTALRTKDTAAALSLLDRGLVVFEFGAIDPTAETYAVAHLPSDIDVAVATQWKLETRRVGGEGNERWVLSSYHLTGTQSDGTPIDQTLLETAILRRSGDSFRIVHLHWSTNDLAYQAAAARKAAKTPQ